MPSLLLISGNKAGVAGKLRGGGLAASAAPNSGYDWGNRWESHRNEQQPMAGAAPSNLVHAGKSPESHHRKRTQNTRSHILLRFRLFPRLQTAIAYGLLAGNDECRGQYQTSHNRGLLFSDRSRRVQGRKVL